MATDRRPMGGMSHVAGPVDEPLIERTIPQVLARTVAARGGAEAAVFPAAGLRWTWAGFAAEVDRMARGLLALGLRKGDRLGVWAPNRPEWLLAQFATARIGVILVTINPAYRLGELGYALKKTGCAAILLAERFRSSDYVAMLRELCPGIAGGRPGQLRLEGFPALRSAIVMAEPVPPGMLAFPRLMAMAEEVPAERLEAATAELRPGDPINIQFTSGTTGLPKGAVLSHRNIVNNAWFTIRQMQLTEADRLAIPVPFYHCFGMVMGTLGCVTHGATMIVPSEGFEAGAVLRALEAERATALYGVPTMFVAMLEHPEFGRFDLSSLRTGIMAGAPCPIEVMRKVRERMHMGEVTIAYGMTETSPVSFQSGTDTPVEKRVSSVGLVHPHVEVKVVDAAGAVVPVGVQGELLTRGYSVMTGYWDDPEQTAQAIDSEGWMHTGDLGTIDAEGYANITGRLKDMILRGGENIYPREVEEFLYTHPEVSQVQVFGIPDARLGEIVCAWVVPKPGARPDEDSIRDFCRDRIAHYKIPALVRIVEALPMTVTGKPQKFLMRQAMIEELGLEVAATA